MLIQFCVLLVVNFGCLNAAEDPIVHLPYGQIKGHILLSQNNKPYYAFQEIPYAAPPIGDNRFKLAKEPEPWSGILETTKNTRVCYQEAVKYTGLNKSEDCLYLNVYTPKSTSSELLPVLVWIHGGGFQSESGVYQYNDPKYVIDHDIVVVSINYRLGPFGFLTTVDDVIPPNIGLKDQIFALEWVQENIGLFGGNKSSVTIAGQSAGSAAVGLHLMGPWPNNKVLFHGAIMQSGSEVFSTRSNNAREIAFEAGKKLDNTFSSTDSKDLLTLLQKSSAEDILKAARTWILIEKDGPFKCQVYECLAEGNYKKVPVIIGFNSEEFIYTVIEKGYQERAAELDKDPSQMIASQFNISSTNRTVASLLLKRVYTNTSFAEDTGAFVRWNSDSWMSNPVSKQAQLQSKLSDVYLYQFAYKGYLGQLMDLPFVKGAERVGHSEDLVYQWANQNIQDLSKYPSEDADMVHRYVTLWTNFVKYRNPTPTEDPLLQNVIWPKIDPKQPDNMQYLNINKTLEVRSNPRYFQKVNQVLDKYITYHDII